MSFYAGLTKGFLNASQQEQQANAQKSAQESDRERRLFEMLVNSDDPEIKALAMTGVLSSTGKGKKKGGLKGWLGEMEQNPLLPQIQALMRTPVQVTPGSAAMPAQNMVDGKPMLPANPLRLNAGSDMGSGAAVVYPGVDKLGPPTPAREAVEPTYGPRQVFKTPAQQANADFETLVSGMNLSPEDRDAANRHRLGLPPTSTRGQFQFYREDGSVGVATFDETGQAIDAFTKQPLPPGTNVVTPGSQRVKTPLEQFQQSELDNYRRNPTPENLRRLERAMKTDDPRPVGNPENIAIQQSLADFRREQGEQNARWENDKRRAEILKDHEKKIADNQAEFDNQLADLETRRAAQADKSLFKPKVTTKPVTSFDRADLLKKKADRDAAIVTETQGRIDSLYPKKSSAPLTPAAGKAGKKPKDSLGIR